jgi:hypothetical protein
VAPVRGNEGPGPDDYGDALRTDDLDDSIPF